MVVRRQRLAAQGGKHLAADGVMDRQLLVQPSPRQRIEDALAHAIGPERRLGQRIDAAQAGAAAGVEVLADGEQLLRQRGAVGHQLMVQVFLDGQVDLPHPLGRELRMIQRHQAERRLGEATAILADQAVVRPQPRRPAAPTRVFAGPGYTSRRSAVSAQGT